MRSSRWVLLSLIQSNILQICYIKTSLFLHSTFFSHHQFNSTFPLFFHFLTTHFLHSFIFFFVYLLLFKMVSFNTLLVAFVASSAVAQSNPHVVDGAKEAMINHQQVIDTLNRQIATDPSHRNADRLVAAITGADSQIDNAIATSAQALAPFTGGASLAVASFLLGPFVQSVTNGAEVALANMVGGAEDRVQNAARTYANNLVNLRAHAASYGVRNTRLDRAITRFQARLH